MNAMQATLINLQYAIAELQKWQFAFRFDAQNYIVWFEDHMGFEYGINTDAKPEDFKYTLGVAIEQHAIW